MGKNFDEIIKNKKIDLIVELIGGQKEQQKI